MKYQSLGAGWKPMRLLVSATAIGLLATSFAAPTTAHDAQTGLYDSFYGDYGIGPNHVIGINRFVNDAGKTVMLFADYRSGIVRRLFPVSGSEFVMGPGFDVSSPVEMRVQFVRGPNSKIFGISLLPARGAATFAKRVSLRTEDVTFFDGKVRLSGTLMLPATRGPHPAIILLHGSGPLTRYSFGPYPHFFTSLGLAVLIYDKRGTGASTGSPVDLGAAVLWWGRSPGQSAALARLAHYPKDLEEDALTAFHFLQGRKDIDAKEIGLWGSSEGGMLATQVAARNHDVAFAIDSSGFQGPFWKTLIYQNGAILRGMGVPTAKVDKVVAYLDLWMRVARTGDDYDLLLKQSEKIRGLGTLGKNVPTLGKDVPPLEEMRWDWDNVLSFNSLPALRTVTCPFLGLWGELDQETDARAAERNTRAMLAESGNRDFTLKIFPDANHPLQEMPSRARMAPGVFETLRSWLRARIDVGGR